VLNTVMTSPSPMVAGDHGWEATAFARPGPKSWDKEGIVVPEKHNIAASRPLIGPDAAGIGVGATGTFVTVCSDRNPEPIPPHPRFIAELEILADSFERCETRIVHPNRCQLL
jgi:hypothetical protein